LITVNNQVNNNQPECFLPQNNEEIDVSLPAAQRNTATIGPKPRKGEKWGDFVRLKQANLEPSQSSVLCS